MPGATSTESKRSMPVSALVPVENVAALGPDTIGYALSQALASWSHDRDVRGLRAALLAILIKLDEVP